MTLKETLRNDMVVAMKGGHKVKVSLIRMLNADIQNKEIEIHKDIDDTGIIAIIEKNIKQTNETLEYAEKANSEQKIAECKEYLVILKSYLPEQLTETEVRKMVSAIISENSFKGKKDMGKVMQLLMPKTKGKFDSKQISAIVGEMLA
jgi:uncharacterized protein YqeY